MPYRSEKPQLAPTRGQLESEIVGWGADLDPARRPAVPKERNVTGFTGAHWDFPRRQIAQVPREMSPEHKFLPPVFGTTCPPKGLSGLIRRKAYTLSEGKTSHWLLLMLADRVDVLESLVTGALSGRPDNFIAEHGYKAELTRHGFRSRFGRNRADVKRLPYDLLLLAGTALAVVGTVRAVRRRKQRERTVVMRIARLLT